MAINNASVRQGGGNLMQQMGAEVVDLYKHFENLQQTKRQVDVMEREQNARVLSGKLDERIEKMGGLWHLVGDENGRALYANYVAQTTGMSLEQAEDYALGIAQLPATQADMIPMLERLSITDKEAMVATNNIRNAATLTGGLLRQGKVDEAAAFRDTQKKTIANLLERLTGVTQETEKPEQTPTTEKAAAPQATSPAEREFDKMGTAEQWEDVKRPGGIPGQERIPTGTLEEGILSLPGAVPPQERENRFDVSGGARESILGVGGQELIQGRRGKEEAPSEREEAPMSSGGTTTRASFEAGKASGAIPKDAKYEDWVESSMNVQETRSKMDAARSKILNEMNANGKVSPETLGEYFRVHSEVKMTEAASAFTDPAKGAAATEIATQAGSAKSFVEATAKGMADPKTRPLMKEIIDEINRVLYSEPVTQSVSRDLMAGRKVPAKKVELAVKREADKIAKDRIGQVQTFYNNLVETGAINNPVYMRQLDPKAAKAADEVLTLSFREREVAVQENRNDLAWRQFEYQKGLNEKLQEAQRKLEELKATDPTGSMAIELFKTLGGDAFQLMNTLIKEGKDANEIHEFFNKNPLLKGYMEGLSRSLEPFAGKLSSAQEEVGMLAALVGMQGDTVWQTPEEAAATEPADEGVGSDNRANEGLVNGYLE